SYSALLFFLFFLYCSGHPPDLHSFPTRRSSDLWSLRTVPMRSLCRVTLHRCSPQRSPPSTSTCRWSTSKPGYAPIQSLLRSPRRSEEHTSELQSRENLVCRLLLEKKKNKHVNTH